MGWLDHSTNNIILDAVLTDYGRQQLAFANSSFNITHYALGDDEVDYRVIKKYGRAVGKEKIEKNTPIFEALTNQNIALKHKLIGRENDGNSIQSVYLPYLKSDSTLSLQKNTTPSATAKVDLYFNTSTGNSVPENLVQRSYTIKVPDRFFVLDSPAQGTLTQPGIARAKIDPGDPNRIATYSFVISTNNQASISFNVTAKNIDNNTLLVYGKKVNATDRTIYSYISVTGDQHGCTINIPVTYTATYSTT